MNATELTLAYHRTQQQRYTLMIPNTHFHSYEMDIMCVRNGSLYVEEIEIKTARSDFLADFRKRAHHGILKHTLLKQGQTVANYFCFLVPVDLLPKIEDDIPDYAGIYTGSMSRAGYRTDELVLMIQHIRRPKRLHKNKVTEKLLYKKARGITFRYWDLLHDRQKARS